MSFPRAILQDLLTAYRLNLSFQQGINSRLRFLCPDPIQIIFGWRLEAGKECFSDFLALSDGKLQGGGECLSIVHVREIGRRFSQRKRSSVRMLW